MPSFSSARISIVGFGHAPDWVDSPVRAVISASAARRSGAMSSTRFTLSASVQTVVSWASTGGAPNKIVPNTNPAAVGNNMLKFISLLLAARVRARHQCRTIIHSASGAGFRCNGE